MHRPRVGEDPGSAQDGHRTSVLRRKPLAEGVRTDTAVQIAHYDVNDATGQYADQLDEFDTFVNIEQGCTALMRYMWSAHDSLAFFIGGDNVIAVCSA